MSDALNTFPTPPLSQPVRVLLVGRHPPEFGEEPIEVITQRDVTFPVTAQGCEAVVCELLQVAITDQTALVFQAIPAQVAVALAHMARHGDLQEDVAIGVCINKLGVREAGVMHTLALPTEVFAQQVLATLKRVNPNVKISVRGSFIEMVVDPPMKFEFSHIEWL